MNKLLFFAIWLLTMVICYWVGLQSNSGSQILDDDNVVTTSSGESIPSGSALRNKLPSLTGSDPSTSQLSSTANMPISQAEESANSRKPEPGGDKILSSHPIERLQAFAELLKNPNQSSIDSALEAYDALPGGPGRFSELKMLAFAWGQVDPVSALEWAKSQQHWDEHVASSSIMDAWAREDPDSAIQWAKENFEGEENPYFVGIINGLSESSLPLATDLMTELPYGRVRGRSAHILFEKVWSKGEDIAVHWAEHLPEGSLQNFAYGELGEKLARSDMSRALEWVESMDESAVKAAVSEDVAREMARQNPVKAGSWIVGLPEGESKQVAIHEVAKVWSKRDPAATAAWINQFPENTNADPAIEQLVRAITPSDPNGALTWAESISDPVMRKQLIEQAEKVIKAQKFPQGEPTE
jgi:hypothetical protein